MSDAASNNNNNNQNTAPPRAPQSVGSLIGHVKWFNNQDGYGFITVVTGDSGVGEDIFVHQSNVYPTVSGYRTLRAGEYVSLNLSDDERPQALDVTGVNGGPLMCDTQITLRNSRPPASEDGSSGSGGGNRRPRQQGRGLGRPRRNRGQGQQGQPQTQQTSNQQSGEGWTTVE